MVVLVELLDLSLQVRPNEQSTPRCKSLKFDRVMEIILKILGLPAGGS